MSSLMRLVLERGGRRAMGKEAREPLGSRRTEGMPWLSHPGSEDGLWMRDNYAQSRATSSVGMVTDDGYRSR